MTPQADPPPVNVSHKGAGLCPTCSTPNPALSLWPGKQHRMTQSLGPLYPQWKFETTFWLQASHHTEDAAEILDTDFDKVFPYVTPKTRATKTR